MKPSNCHVMAKPTGSICNLDCSYCFYLEKEKLYPERKSQWKMDPSTLEAFIKQQIDAQDYPEVTIAWQGGEPTLMGLEFFERAMELVDKHNPERKRIINTFQTNGVLINDAWCSFFKKNNFLIGLSIDGPEEFHDAYRVNRAGKPTHTKVINALNCLKKHGVEFNTLTVVNNLNVHHPIKVYEYLKSLGSTVIQFIPLIERKARTPNQQGLTLIGPDYQLEADITEWSVDSLAYGQFLSEIFKVWVKRDIGSIWVQMFEQTFAAWCEQPPQMCHFAENCGSALALEANGDVYNCDHYVYPEYKLGNLHETSIREMNLSQQSLDFGRAKRQTLSSDCQKCEFKFACHGGCPKHRFIRSSSGKADHNYLCQGYKEFFKNSKPYMTVMRDLWKRGSAPMSIMHIL